MSAKEKATAALEAIGRFGLLEIARKWVEVLQRSDECKGWGQSDVVKKAIDDIRSGAVTLEEIEKRRANLKKTAPEIAIPVDAVAALEEQIEKKAREEAKEAKKHEKGKKSKDE